MPFNQSLGRIAARAAAALAAAVALASCGGGTYQVHAFVPGRILTFGDEGNSLVGTQGLKYSINGTVDGTAATKVDCGANPLWTQVLATSFEQAYSACNSQQVALPASHQAFDLSTVNATVADTADQVHAFESGDTFRSNDLVTIWVGMHDVLNEYEANGSGVDEATLVAAMSLAGENLAALVNEIAGTGAKVVLLTIPDLGYSPFAYQENQRGDFDRVALLSHMTLAFNNALRANVINDGSKVGLVLADDFVKGAVRSPGSYGLITNPNQTPACPSTVPLPSCSDGDVPVDPSRISNTPAMTYLWADPTHLGPVAHQQIGNQANSRAHTNPF